MELTEAVHEQLIRASVFHNFVIEEYAEGTFTSDLRNRLFVALCDIVLEHHGAIINLVESGQHYGSALALLRPLIEACLRAFWTLYCADDQHLLTIVEGKKNFPAFDACRQLVEGHFASQKHPGSFEMPKGYISQLHGLTHTGVEALQFRFDKNIDIKPTYPDKALCKLLQQATMYLTMSALAHVHMVEAMDDTPPPKSNRLTAKYLELFKPPNESEGI